MPFKLLLQGLIILLVVAVMFAVATGAYQVASDPAPILLQGGERTEIGVGTDAEDYIDAATSEKVHLVAQFERYLTQAEERLLERSYGIQILEVVPEYAYVVALPTDTAKAILLSMMAGTPAVKAVVSIRAEDRFSPSLGTPADISPPGHAILRKIDPYDSEHLTIPGGVTLPVISTPDPTVAPAIVHVIIHFFDDVAWDDQTTVLGGVGAKLSAGVKDSNIDHAQWLIMLDQNQLSNLLEFDAVRWVEAIPAPPVDDLHEARGVIDFNGSAGGGAGVLIAQWELCQPYMNHPGFQGRINHRLTANSPASCGDQLNDNNRPKNWHSTMVAGIMSGAPVDVPDVVFENSPQKDFYGIAAEANIIAYGVHGQLASQKDDNIDAMEQGATISQNSWGSACEVYQDSNIAPYLWASALYDRVSSGRNYLGMDSGYPGRMLVVTSAGNYGDEKTVTSLWGSVRISNSAKNALVVGNVNTQAKSSPTHWAHVSSGRGPTIDGRLEPLISAPGIRLVQPLPVQQQSTNTQSTFPHDGIRSTYPTNQYKRASGTSFSAPMVSGAAALATETYRSTCPADPTPMELRAIMLHTAFDLKEAKSTLGSQVKSELTGGYCAFLGGTASGSTDAEFGLNPEFQVQGGSVYEGPDYIYGYGLLQTETARDFIRQSHFTTGTISRGYVEYDVEVQAADLEDNQLRVTLAWDDPPWPINVPPSTRHGLLQNDLDLELIDPSGRRHLPWVLDPDNPAQPAKRHSSRTYLPVTMEMRDQRNTIEQVAVEAPEFGTWTIRVRAGLMIRPAQSFTLVSRAISPQTTCGELSSRLVEDPFELPDSWLWWWLMWLAIAVLVLMILVLLWLIWITYKNQPGWQTPWLHMLLAFAILAVVFYLVFLQLWLVLAVLMILLLIVAVLLS
jgi:hypothetical protein